MLTAALPRYTVFMAEDDLDLNPLHNVTSVIILMNGLLQKMSTYAQHVDTQSNIIIGLGAAIFVFSASNFHLAGNKISWPLLMLALFSGAAALIGLLAINPPRFMRKRHQTESLFYHRRISKYNNFGDYYADLRNMLKDEEEVIKETSKELYNLARYSWRPKRILFEYARNMMFIGFSLSFIIFLFQTIFRY